MQKNLSTAPTPSPNDTCRFCLVRHGETDWNMQHRLQGHEDIPLNLTGLLQAQRAAYALKNERFVALYCSDMQRAHQTANAIAYPSRLLTRASPYLRERHYGVFQGLTYDEAAKKYPGLYDHFKSRDPSFALPCGGESLNNLVGRIIDTLTTLAGRHIGEKILVVTHGGVLDVVYRLATGMAFGTKRNFPIPNAAGNWLDYRAGKWQLRAWGVQFQAGGARDEMALT